MKVNELGFITAFLIIIAVLLSVLNIIAITILDILSYSFLVSGIMLVYSESVRQKRLMVFFGSIIFLLGVYFLVVENFNLNISEGVSIPIILVFAGAGLLVLHLSTSTNKIYFILSVILLSSGITLLASDSQFKVGTFLRALVPVFKFLWPVIIIILILLFLRTKY